MLYGIASTLGSDSVSIIAIETLTDAELVKQVDDLKKQIKLLRLENEVLEASILKLQPGLIVGVYSALDYAMKVIPIESRMTVASPNRSMTSRLGLTDTTQSSTNYNTKSLSRISYRKKDSLGRGTSTVKISRSNLSLVGPKINIEERLELLFAVMANQGKDLAKFKDATTKKNAVLEAKLKEIGLRTSDYEKWSEEFEIRVIVGGVEEITKRIPAETWIKYMTDQDKAIDKQISKFLLRTSTLNSRHRKLKEDIKRKTDLVERLLPIDIEIKTIQNKTAMRAIENKRVLLGELIMTSGDIHLNLTRHSNNAMMSSNYLQKVKQLGIQRTLATEKLNAERYLLEAQVDVLKQRLSKVQNLRNTYYTPDIIEYVKVKLQVCNLNNSIKLLETSQQSVKQFALASFRKEIKKSMMLIRTVK